MDLDDLFPRFAVALGIGLLVGLERGWKQRGDDPGTRTAGLRTFSLVGLLGGVFGALAQALGGATSTGAGVLLGLSFALFAAVFAVFCFEENRAEKTFSATTAIAGMLTFALAAFALVGDLRMAAAAGVLTAGLLAGREVLHGWLQKITWPELRSALVLLTMTFVALPLLPNESIGPLGGINPREIWLIAIVLAAVSFLGYVAVKYLGDTHGVLLAAAAGGLVSSTAVMVSSARRAAAGESTPALLAAGASLATAVSLGRTLVLVAVLNSALLSITAPPLLAGTAIMVAAAYLLAFRGRREQSDGTVKFRNPFDLKSVVLFALLLGVVTVVGRILSQQFGAAGAVVAALATGLADVDAATVSIAPLAPQPLSAASAGLAILAAVASNTLSKLAMGVAIGRGRFAVLIAITTAVAFVAAFVAAVAVLALVP